ncbi:metallopeptidase family protein [Leucobacter coleopterorum]|uniref:metallopeptidase family protein n=1 Tax=Leucobacter coleopterorum TaxID=2714933 RepID=UPI001FCAA369|nr:metallopeptidase family protein [Leucobacter coleopterorum]
MSGRESHSDRRASARRHGRRPIRSSITGPGLPDPGSRFARFETDARGVVEMLQALFPEELDGVQIGFQTAPSGSGESQFPLLYAIDRAAQTIILYRMPIQRARGLHVDDDEHRRYFVEHCVYRAVCEYLGKEPWELLPGRFEHY